MHIKHKILVQEVRNCVKILLVAFIFQLAERSDENEKDNKFENKTEQEGN